MSCTRLEMIGMTSRKFPGVRNTSYYGVQVVHCVRRSREYRKSSKTTKYALRAVACVSTCSDEGLRAFDGSTCELNVEEWVETGSKWHGGCGEKWGPCFLSFFPDVLSAHIRLASFQFGSLIHSLGLGTIPIKSESIWLVHFWLLLY